MNKKILFAAFLMAASASSAQKRAFTISDLYSVKGLYGVSLSPDGQTLAYTVSTPNLKEHKSASDVFTLTADGKTTHELTDDGQSGVIGWSADGQRLFLLSWKDGSAQVYSYDVATCQSTKLTDYALGVTDPVVSADGKHIAFSAEVYPDLDGADGAAHKERARRKAGGPVQAHMADSLMMRHWDGYLDGRCKHLIIYNVETRTYKDLTPGRQSLLFSLGGAVYAFSPDGKELCYAANLDPRPAESTNSDLWTVSVEGGKATSITAANKAWDGSPLYSPDGKYIAYRFQTIPGYESDLFALALYDRATGKSETLTEGLDNWVESAKWAADSKSLYFTVSERGAQPLYRLDLAKRRMTKVISGKAISEFDLDARGNLYYTYSTTGKPSALYASDKKGRERQLTFLNQRLEDEVDIRPSESHWVMGAGGDSVQYFIVKPHGFDPQKKYPLVINVHGGPQMQWMNSFRGDWQVYPGAGYVVAYPNPHGSTGYGQKFTRAISGDWGGKVYEDIMRVTDELSRLSYVDSTRMAAMGWSYGGYMMNWLQGHTRRFKCLASMMGLYDMRSMWGSTEELWFPNFDLEGQPWNSNLYEKWSPSSYVDRFATPTLIMTGERDYRVCYTQSLQYFTTLQYLGIPSRLIVLSNDGHWPASLTSMPLYYNAHLEWFHRWLGGDPAPWDTEKMVNNQVEY